MGRPRSSKHKHLPKGLYYRKDRGIYELRRIDGSTKSIGDSKLAAIALARDYNEAYRVPDYLKHPIAVNKDEEKRQSKSKAPLDEFLVTAFNKLAQEKNWVKGTLANNRQWFEKIHKHFKDISAAELSYTNVIDFFESKLVDVTPNIHNRHLSLIKGVFAHLLSDGIIESNPADKRKRLTVIAASIDDLHRLSIEDFKKVHKLALAKNIPHLAIAMELALQTAHGVLEVSRIKYSDVVNDKLFIIREKNKKKAASRVAIPFDSELARIFKESKKDGIKSSYVVHYRPARKQKTLSSRKTEDTQLCSEMISVGFSDLRDELGLHSHIPKAYRPTFHDIRALSINIYKRHGYNPQHRAAHSSAAMTDHYAEGHDKFNYVSEANIVWQSGDVEVRMLK